MDQVVALPLPTTAEEFLVWEEFQTEKFEFDGQQAVLVTGGTWEHSAIEVNIVAELQERLRGSHCRVFGDTMKVQIGSSIRYPDAIVTCTELAPRLAFIPAPVVMFEVVSPSSEETDREIKLGEYCSVPSVQRYVLVDRDRCAVTVYARDGAGWGEQTLDEGEDLVMPEIGVTIPVAGFYEGVFPPA